MLKKVSYLKRMGHQLSSWRKRFEARRAEAGLPGATVTPDARERLEASKIAGDAAFAKLAELRGAARRYVALRTEMDSVWRSIDDRPPAAREEPIPPPVRRKPKPARPA